MIGDNLDPVIRNADDARAYAAAIDGLRAEAERIKGEYKPHLDTLEAEAKGYRTERDEKLVPVEMQERALREVLAAWLVGDPDGNLKDGDRVIATISRKLGQPQIHPDQVPDDFKSLVPDMAKINAAIARGERVPGVVPKITNILTVKR